MPLFGCANDEQFENELSELDYDLHYCESHNSYYCEYVDSCNPDKKFFPALNECRAYRRINAK